MSNFDTVFSRQDTSSLKWDLYRGKDILPFWVADMDLPGPASDCGQSTGLSSLFQFARSCKAGGCAGATDPSEQPLDLRYASHG